MRTDVAKNLRRGSTRLLVIFLLLPLGAMYAKAEDFSLEFPEAAACPADHMPYSRPKVATIFTRLFERRPEFERTEWSHNFPDLKNLKFYPGDFNCDGRSDLLAHEANTDQMFLGLSDKNGHFAVSSVGKAPENLRWEYAQVAPYHQYSCATLLLPRHLPTRQTFAARFCGGEQLSWQQIDFPYPQPEFRDMLFGDALKPGSENFFTVPFAQAPYLRTEMSPATGGGKEKEQSSIPPADRPAVGTARWSSTERSALVVQDSPWEFLYWKLGEQAFPFIRLPKGLFWEKPVLADLNGDSLSDMVVPSKGAQGTWIVLAYGDYRLLFPNLSLTRATQEETIHGVGDFDGDGKDDLLLIHENSLQVISQKPTAVIPFQRIQVGKDLHQSDDQGKILLSLDSLETLNIVVSKTELGVSTPSISRRVDSRLFRPVNILFDPFPSEERGALVRAPNLPTQGPYLCATVNRGGEPNHPFGRTLECPKNFAFLELDDSGPPSSGTCCRLPADDILGSESFWTVRTCPENTVLTALRKREKQEHQGDSIQFDIRCTTINTARYSLSSPYPGYLFGEGGSLSIVPEEIDRSRIPLAYRRAFGSILEGSLDIDGCLGQPWGALLTAIKGKDCKTLEFRALLEKDANGKLTPVQMYPDCKTLSDPYDPSRGCRP